MTNKVGREEEKTYFSKESQDKKGRNQCTAQLIIIMIIMIIIVITNNHHNLHQLEQMFHLLHCDYWLFFMVQHDNKIMVGQIKQYINLDLKILLWAIFHYFLTFNALNN